MTQLETLSLEIEKRTQNDPVLKKRILSNIEKLVSSEYKGFALKESSLQREYFAKSTPLLKSDTVITAKAFWWGFHLDIPNQALDDIGEAIKTGAAVSALIGTVSGPATPFIALAVGFIEIEYAWMRGVNRGNGVYLSMSWFAAGIFVPTAR